MNFGKRNNPGKSEYEALEMEIVRIDMEDVLNASPASGGGNGGTDIPMPPLPI